MFYVFRTINLLPHHRIYFGPKQNNTLFMIYTEDGCDTTSLAPRMMQLISTEASAP